MGRPKNFSREEVLEKAMPVFWRQGFSDTSLQDLDKQNSPSIKVHGAC
jgi:TetR/AcrR family transcriptional regulator, copper-responsive repressor